MYGHLQKVLSKQKNPKTTALNFGPWPGGIVTEYWPGTTEKGYLANAVNFILVKGGYLRTRDGVSLVSSGCTGEVKFVGDIKVGGTWYTMVTDDDNKVYKDVAGTATLIGEVEGTPRVVSFMNVAVIMDGSYGKYWTGSGDIKILYDDGTGTTGYQFNGRGGSESGNVAIGDGTNTRVSQKFTSQSWDTGYTIPPTSFYVTLRKEGDGYFGTDNQPVMFRLRKQSDDSILAAAEITATAGEITDTATEYSVTLTDSDITSEMSQSIGYYASVEFGNGDASNHIKVYYSTVASGSDPLSIYAGSWSDQDGWQLLGGLKPGRPPKMKYGKICNQRLYAIEGESGTNPSYLWYSNTGNHLDWSTSDGGGYAPLVDTSAQNYPIGGIAVWNNTVWVFGTPRQPVLSQLSGDSPNDYVLNPHMQRVHTHQEVLVETGGDMIFAHAGGVDTITGVQEYGDVRSVSMVEDAQQSIRHWYNTNAFAGYIPEWGIYLLKFEGHTHIYAVHTSMMTGRPRGGQLVPHYPVTRWKFNLPSSQVPTCFGHGDGYAYIGTDGGKVYRTDKAEVQDAGNAVDYSFQTRFESTGIGELAARKLHFKVLSMFGGSYDILLYKNDSWDSFQTISTTPILSEPSLPEIWTIPIEDADFTLEQPVPAHWDRRECNFNFRSFMFGVDNVVLDHGYPLWFAGLTLICDRVGGY